MNRVCVFCASSNGSSNAFLNSAYILGSLLAENNLSLVYGGAKVGLMGKVADGVIDNGGKVTGVLPHFFNEEHIAHAAINDMRLVRSMDERKKLMIDISDAFIALPGGFGTLDEISEVLSLAQLGQHVKPLGLLNINSFFDPLLQMFKEMAHYDYLKNAHMSLFIDKENPRELLSALMEYKAPALKKWI